jgi:hypothetical protein
MIGAWALWLMYLWLASAIIAAYLSERKGYGDKPGLATGLLLSALGPLIWLVVPPKPDSKWKTVGAFRRRKAEDALPPGETTVDGATAEGDERPPGDDSPTGSRAAGS